MANAKPVKRLCIFPKDVQLITGKSERYGRDVLKKILEANNKQPHQLVTIEEFSAYFGLKKKQVQKRIV